MISRIAVLIASSSIIVSSAGAQYSHPIELGLDAGISVGLGDNSLTVIHFPVQALRLGFFLDKSKSIEPKVALTTVTGDNGYTAYRGELGFLFHFYGRRRFDIFPDRTPRSAVYVRPFAGIEGISTDGPDTHEDIIGIGAGVKSLIADRLAARFEANLAEFYRNNTNVAQTNDEFTVLGLLAGLSFFFR
jgi:hypothetical protein